ncbi:hypothetical protein H8959_017735 [Pygathrix nigripes]
MQLSWTSLALVGIDNQGKVSCLCAWSWGWWGARGRRPAGEGTAGASLSPAPACAALCVSWVHRVERGHWGGSQRILGASWLGAAERIAFHEVDSSVTGDECEPGSASSAVGARGFPSLFPEALSMTLTERYRQYRHVHTHGLARPHAHRHDWPVGWSGASGVGSIKSHASLIASKVGPERPGEELEVPSPSPRNTHLNPGAPCPSRLRLQPHLSVLRLSPSMGHPLEVGLALRHLLFLLEYCMVTGYDWWDILLHVQPSMVQSLVEKLHEEYTRQTAALQQVLSTRILAMKASLCKLSPCTVTRVCDYHTKLFLIAISSTLKSLLRPHFLNTPDKSPGDRLTEICAKITDVDIDKVMINLKTEEFVLDMNTLQALQQLLQWVGDFVLYLLASLPNQGSLLRPGHSFLRDGTSLGMLRELMVVIRIWGLLKPSCLPVYTATSDTQDSMSLLFRLLTKLWICCEAPCPLLLSLPTHTVSEPLTRT